MNQAKCGFISGAPPVTSTVSMPGRAATASTASSTARSAVSVRCGPDSTWQWAQARLQRAVTLTWIVDGSPAVCRQEESSTTSSKYTSPASASSTSSFVARERRGGASVRADGPRRKPPSSASSSRSSAPSTIRLRYDTAAGLAAGHRPSNQAR